MKTIEMMAADLKYYETLIDYLIDTIPSLDGQIEVFNEEYFDAEE